MDNIIYFKEKIDTRIFLFAVLYITSFFGELIVTIISLLIANPTKMDFKNLVFMMSYFFTIKTVIIFSGICSAISFLYKAPGINKYKTLLNQIKHPFKFCKQIFLTAGQTQKNLYILESINLKSKTINLFFISTKSIISFSMQELIFNEYILKNCCPIDSAHIGYYYGMVESRNGFIQKANEKFQILTKGELNIIAICRDGKLALEDSNSQFTQSMKPLKLYENKSLLIKFSPTQALYIGYLASHEKKNLDH